MIAMAVIIELGCQKQFVPLQSAVFECSACSFFRFSITSDVKMTEAGMDGGQDIFVVLLSMIFICAVSEYRNGYAIM